MSYVDGALDIFVSGLDRIELLGSNSRYIMFCEYFAGRRIVRRSALRMIMPNSALPDAIAKSMRVPCMEEAPAIRRLLPMFLH